MLIVGYCYSIRFEKRLCEELELHLAYRWFCRLDLDDKVPDHSTFSVNRQGRFRAYLRPRHFCVWKPHKRLAYWGVISFPRFPPSVGKAEYAEETPGEYV